ncbi:tail fiber domain-containing protein, partial [Burkholderia multivorans]|uniref:tail fiber domain-containing protein n=1 Tax=Burkholderia multivorans TaxID=87883 RepID=UPI001C241D0F
MELSLILSDDTESYVAILGQFIESSAAETHADRILAQQAAETATNSANSALDSAGQAAQSAAASADSAANAAASAAAASTSEQHASQYAAAAQSASTDAASSASSAAGSASSAAVSATNAANSATAASISEQNAAATLANALKKANNLSDVADAVAALANLGGAPKANPTFTGNVGVPTRAAGDNGNYAASTAFVAASFLPRTGGTMTGWVGFNGSTQASVPNITFGLNGVTQWMINDNGNADFTVSKNKTDGSWDYDPVVVGKNGNIQFQVRSGAWFNVLSDQVYSVLSLGTANGFRMQMRASQNVGTEWVNSANSAVNMTLYDGGDLLVRGNMTAFSDRRVKSNIKRIKGAMAKVRALVGVTFTRRRSEDKTRHMGFIAQDVEPIVPEVVRTDEKGMKSIAYANLTALLAEAMKDLD